MKQNKFYLLGCLLIIISGCTSLPTKHIHTHIDIKASPQAIWAILTDNTAYPEWNPYHVKVQGTLAKGESLDIIIHKPNADIVEVSPRVLRMTPHQELVWGGGVPGLFTGEHRFLLQPLDDQHTRLIQQETFSGIGLPFASLESVEEGYQLMNKALKKRAEWVTLFRSSIVPGLCQ